MNEDVKAKMVDEMKSNIENGEVEKFANKVVEMNDETLAKVEEIKNQVLAEMEAYNETKVLPKGFRACTKEEKKWLDLVIEGAKNSQTASTSIIPEQMPLTVIDEIFQYIKDNHELINEVNVINTKGRVRWIQNTGVTGAAVWGDLCDEISGEIKSGFKFQELGLYKLTAFSYICLTLLDMGYEWLMRYCVMVLGEAIAEALEAAIVSGNGSKKPVGMTKDITVEEGVESIDDKTPMVVNDLGAATLGTIFAELAQAPNGKVRPVNNVIMVVNPLDKYSLVLPAISYRNALGEYAVRTALPIKIVESAQVARNSAIFGLGKKYDLMLGLGEDGKMTFSDHFKFLDDVRTLKQKLVANGRAKDNHAFVVADITNLKPDYFNVKVVEEEASI
ncbi:MAG: phage major capsid protein [Bacteroidales bacterium]|nr:phage major capsid protein [Candidatus Scybalousia scybalohippi]